jgi:hypothetical protein
MCPSAPFSFVERLTLQQDDAVNCNNSCAGIHVLERMMMTMVVLLMMMMMMMIMMTNARILPRMGQDHFLINILQFISHRDAIIRRCMVFGVEFVLQ